MLIDLFILLRHTWRGSVSFFLGREHYNHALAFEKGHLLDFAVFLQVVGETQKQHFALFLEEYRATFEEYVGLDLGTFLEEALGMFELEVVVVVVRLGPETDLLYNHLGALGLDFLGLLLLLVEVLLVVQDLAHGRVRLGADFHQVEFEFFRYLAGLVNGIDSGGDIVAYQADLSGTDVLVDVVRSLLGLMRIAAGSLRGLRTTGTGGDSGAGATGVVRGFFIHSVSLLICHGFDLVGQKLRKGSNFHRT